jgi:CHASE2 domain-containing sensor protein
VKTRRWWWRFARVVALGLAITAAVASLDYAGHLAPLERWTYDLRVRHCQQFFQPPPEDVVHILIDDQSLERGGHRPVAVAAGRARGDPRRGRAVRGAAGGVRRAVRVVEGR